MKQRRQSHVWAKEKRGHYVEPAWVSERLFATEKFSGLIYDPAVGWGRITTAAKAAGYVVHGTDIIDRKKHGLVSFERADFLDGRRTILQKFSVVMNPPFDHVEVFAWNAFKMGAEKIAMIMLVRRLNAAHWLSDLPLEKILLLTPRPSMPPGSWIAAGNKPGGGTQDFCWVIISRGYQGDPKLGWLHRDGEK
jgi:hypothetical protein